MNSNICSICLKINKLLVSVHDLDSNNVRWLTKLQFLIPELEWLEEYVICENCWKQLQLCWEFKKFVLDLERNRRQEISNCCSNTGNDNIEDNCDIKYMHGSENNSNNNKIEDVFTCYNCSESFSSKGNLMYHIENEHKGGKEYFAKLLFENHIEGENLYDISVASEDYLNGDPLSFENKQISEYKINPEEISSEIKKEPYLHHCEKCSISFPSVQEFNVHTFSKHISSKSTEDVPVLKKRRGRKPLRKFYCEICNEEFCYVKLITEHCVSVHSMDAKIVKPYSCEKCEMRFVSSANLDQHRNYHDKNRRHICSLCGKGFITKSDLTTHEYTHYNRRNYRCTMCDKGFNTNKNLRTHHLVVHTDHSFWKYVCSICKKRFPLKTNYDQHLRRHTGEKEYACHICKKPFISKSELKRHMHMHSNIKAFKCTNCDREYKERRTYQAHLVKKHGIGNAKVTVREKKFVCHICPSAFYDKQKLMRHICRHSGLKPFSCCACDKKFTDNSYLKQHLRNVHNIEKQLDNDVSNNSNTLLD